MYFCFFFYCVSSFFIIILSFIAIILFAYVLQTPFLLTWLGYVFPLHGQIIKKKKKKNLEKKTVFSRRICIIKDRFGGGSGASVEHTQPQPLNQMFIFMGNYGYILDTVFTINILILYFHLMYLSSLDKLRVWPCLKLQDKWQTVWTQIRRRIFRCLIWVYTVCSGLSFRIRRVSTDIWSNQIKPPRPPPHKKFWIHPCKVKSGVFVL